MKALSLIALSLCAVPLAAQDFAPKLDGRIVLFVEAIQPAEYIVASTSAGNVYDQAGGQVGIGVRFMGEMAMAPGFYYELGGRLDSGSNMDINGDVGGGVTLNTKKMKFTYSYWMVGAAYMKTWGDFTLGGHLEARGEALHLDGTYTVNGGSEIPMEVGNTYLRPWARLSADYTFGSGRYRTVVGIEGAVALLRMSQDTIAPPEFMDKRTLNSMAPHYSASVYVGLRF